MTNAAERQIREIKIYDTTLRDGNQDLRSRLSVSGKLHLIKVLDEWGVDYIEAGWPDSNPNDSILFQEMKDLELRNAQLVAFGRTAKPYANPEYDEVLEALINTKTKVVTLVGKSDIFHVEDALKTTPDENLRMIQRSIEHLRKAGRGRGVIFDAEHFFDGYKRNPDYALATLEAATTGGAETLTLCDTNGWSHYRSVRKITEVVKRHFPKTDIGIHVHNDRGFALTSTLEAIEAGATQIQGVVNGFGERAGNVDLVAVVANLDHHEYTVRTNVDLTKIPVISQQVAQVSEIPVPANQPISGELVFTDNAGLHGSGTRRNRLLYRGVDPRNFGRENEIGFSDQGGGANALAMAERLGFQLSPNDPEYSLIVRAMKERRVFGDAQAFLLFNEILTRQPLPFYILERQVFTEIRNGKTSVRATLLLQVHDEKRRVESLGTGPVDAFNKALLEGLSEYYPQLANVKLIDYEVPRTEKPGSDVEVEVRIHFSSNGDRWTSRVRSTNIEEASQDAIIQGYQSYILQQENSHQD